MNICAPHRNGGKGNLLKAWMRMPIKPAWTLVVGDSLLLVVSLLVFALFHLVIPYEKTSLGIRTAKKAAAITAVENTDTDTLPPTADFAAPVQTLADHSVPGDFSALYPDKFTAATQIVTDNTLQSPKLNITVSEYYNEPTGDLAGQCYYVADFYIRNIECLQTAFSQDKFGRDITAGIE